MASSTTTLPRYQGTHQSGKESISSIGTIRAPQPPPPSSTTLAPPISLLALPALDSGYQNHHSSAPASSSGSSPSSTRGTGYLDAHHSSGGSSPAWSNPPTTSTTPTGGLNLTLTLTPTSARPNLSAHNSNSGFKVISRPANSSHSSSSNNSMSPPIAPTIRPVPSPGLTRDTSHYPFYTPSNPFGVDLSRMESAPTSLSLPASGTLDSAGGEVVAPSTRSSPGQPTVPLPLLAQPEPPRRSSTQSLLTQQILSSPPPPKNTPATASSSSSSSGLVRRESAGAATSGPGLIRRESMNRGVVGGMIKRNSFLGKAFGGGAGSHTPSSSGSLKGKERELEFPTSSSSPTEQGAKTFRNPSSSTTSSHQSISTSFPRGRRQSQQQYEQPPLSGGPKSPILGSASSTSSTGGGGWGSLGALKRGASAVGRQQQQQQQLEGKVARYSTSTDVMGTRSRNVSEGSRVGGSEGEGEDVIETAELLFNRDPSSGRKMINQYLIMQEIGRGQHGTVRLGKDMSTPTPEHSRSATAASSVPSTPGRSNPPSALGLNDLGFDGNSSFAAAQSQFAPIQNQVLTDPDLPAALSLSMAAHGGIPTHGQGGGGFWAIKIVDRQPRRKLPGAGSKKGFGALQAGGGGQGAAGGPTTGEKIKREIAILKKCRHPNVVRLREVIDAPISKKIYLILEYCEGGELKWKTDDGKPYLTVGETRSIFRDVVCGLQYLHHQGIIHRDIKPANLLFAADGIVKISDFGVSHYSHVLRGSNQEDGASPDDEDPAFMDDHDLAKTAGSPAFFAPELCYNGEVTPMGSTTPHRENAEFRFSSFSAGSGGSGGNRNSGYSAGSGTIRPDSAASAEFKRNRPPITQAIDVWALGVTLYCLLFAKTPFEAPSEYALFSVIPVDDYEVPPTMGADEMRTGGRQGHKMAKGMGPSEEAKEVLNLLEKLLEKDPMKRIKLSDVKKHPFTLRGLSDQGAWLASTDPGMDTFVTVSNDEVAAAVTDTGSFKDRFKKGMKHITQMSHKLHLFGSGSSKSRSRSGSVVTASEDRSSAFPSESGSTSTSFMSAASQLASPNMKPASRNTSGSKGTPRIPSGQSDTSGRPSSPKPAGSLSRRFSALNTGTPKKLDHPSPAPIHVQAIQLASPSTATLPLPDTEERLGRSMSDRSTTSSSGYLPSKVLLQRRQSTHLAAPMSAAPSSSGDSRVSAEPRPGAKGLATSTSLERMDNIILRSLTPGNESPAPNRRGMTNSLRRRQSSDVDTTGRQRAISNASSSGGLQKLARYISRGLSQKSSTSSRVSSHNRSLGHLAPNGEGGVSPPSDRDDTLRSGIDYPAVTGLGIKSGSAEDMPRRSMDTLSSSLYSAALSSPSLNHQRLPPIPQADWDTSRGLGLSPEKDRVTEQEEVDWDGGELTEDDDDDYGQDLRPYRGIPRGDDDLLQGQWRIDSSGWHGGHSLLPSPIPKQGLGLIDTSNTSPGRFFDADEGSPDTVIPPHEASTPVGNMPSAARSSSLAPPMSPTPGGNVLPSDNRRRSFSSKPHGISRSPFRGGGSQERARSPLGILSLDVAPSSPLRFSDRASADDEDDDDEGLAIAVGSKRGRRASKPPTPLMNSSSLLPGNGLLQ